MSASLGPILSAAFPVVIAGVFVYLLVRGVEKLHEWQLAAEMSAEAWEKINHESTLALDNAAKGLNAYR
jgi:hypothetical protein